MPERMLKIQFKIIAQKVMRKMENLPSIPALFLKERERERAARPVTVLENVKEPARRLFQN